MSLTLRADVPDRGVDAALSVEAGTTLAVIGPNGSGKSTLLSVASGLLRPPDAVVAIDGRDVSGLPPHERGAGLLTQDPLLFRHLDVRDNVAFGPRSRGYGRSGSRRHAQEWLRVVGASDLARRRPSQLSGGQAQRVALARALAAQPSLLLLDEPMSALDVAAAAAIRNTLREVLEGASTVVLVTHDVLDVLLLADHVAVLTNGRVVERGPASVVMERPRSPFAAEFFGWNLMRGHAVGPDAVGLADGRTVHGVATAHLAPGCGTVAVFRPSAVSLHLRHPEGSDRNVFDGRVSSLEPLGALVRVRVGALRADVTPSAIGELGARSGLPLHLAVKAADVALYPA